MELLLVLCTDLLADCRVCAYSIWLVNNEMADRQMGGWMGGARRERRNEGPPGARYDVTCKIH